MPSVRQAVMVFTVQIASNSLLESLVFARRAALDIAKEEAKELPKENTVFSPENYTDIEKLHQENRKLVRQEIERMKQIYEQQHNHDIKCG